MGNQYFILLNAGLSNLEAFTANAFYTAGQVLFEVPTGIVADAWGRRLSYLLGAITLMLSTLIYVMLWTMQVPFWMWAMSSVFLGLGFTFFTGATEAWIVDALNSSHHSGNLDSIFAKAQIAAGAAMLVGTIAGGVIAQLTNLGIPYIIRAFLLLLTFLIAYFYMYDLGFTPIKPKHPMGEMKKLLQKSVNYGFRAPPVRWIVLSSPFLYGAYLYGFYALQPYLLELYGDPKAYSIAGLAAAAIASSQIVGGLIVPTVRSYFRKRTSILLGAIFISSFVLLMVGIFQNFYLALMLVVIWGICFAVFLPVSQALINDLIPSQQRAKILSFNNLMGSSGGVIAQPALGRAADVFGYAFTFVVCGFISAISMVFIFLVRHEKTDADLLD